MSVVIVGGGMAGLVLARALAGRGISAEVLEAAPPDRTIPGPIMLPYQAYDALREIGLYDSIRAEGREIAPAADGTPVAISVSRQRILDHLSEGVQIRHLHRMIDLLREGDRVVGLRAATSGGQREFSAELVVGADGAHSNVRGLSGIPAETTPAKTASLSFRSPVMIDEAFAMAYQSDGRQVGLLGWSEGSAGWWQIDRMGAEAALAPGHEAYCRGFAQLLPAAEPALAGVSSDEQLIYREATEVRCERWWAPGVALIGEAAHAIDPEAGIGAGLGFGDAQALAVAVAQADDVGLAGEVYEHWRRPAVAPYEHLGGAGGRLPDAEDGPRPPHEQWPPAE